MRFEEALKKLRNGEVITSIAGNGRYELIDKNELLDRSGRDGKFFNRRLKLYHRTSF